MNKREKPVDPGWIVKLYTEDDPLMLMGIKVWLVHEGPNRERYIAEPPVFHQRSEREYVEPTMRLSPECLRQWMEKLRLNHEGIRTDDDHKIKGTLDATKYHLEDMRKLVFERGNK